MNKTALAILAAIFESIYSPYEGGPLSKEEKLEILNDLISQLEVEKGFVEENE